MANLYRRYMRILDKWPLDKTKNPDLGQHLRDKVKTLFPQGEKTKIVDEKKVLEDLEVYERIVSNYYKNKYPVSIKRTASNLQPGVINYILTPEGQQIVNESKKIGFFLKLKQSLGNLFNKTSPEEEQNKFLAFRFKTVLRFCNTESVCQKNFEYEYTKFNKKPHTPVMVNETLKYLNLAPGDVMVDMTFGAGGHSKCILESVPNVKIFALDRDAVAMNYAEELGKKYPGQVIPLLGRFSELPELLEKYNVRQNSIDGFLFDFGVSSMQFDTPERGFMISKNGPLDMRMDGDRYLDQPTAADVLARADEKDLYHIIKYYGEEKRAKKIARALIEARYTFRNLRTTQELAKFIESLFPNDVNIDQLGRFQHSATKTFQALRIFVNNELNEINHGVVIAEKLLKINGRMITIAFHSLEDTIVKRHLSGNVTDSVANQLPLRYRSYGKVWESKEDVKNLTESSWLMLHKHILTPTDEEVFMNPRSRSAKFRALIKIK